MSMSKPGIIDRTLGRAWRAGPTWRGIARQSFAPAADGARLIADGLRRIRAAGSRDWDREQELMRQMREDFALLREIWGFTPDQEPLILRNMRIHRWTLLGLLPVVWWATSASLGYGMHPLPAVEAGACLSILLLAGAIKISYRIEVLSERQFWPFREWLAYKVGVRVR